MTLLLKKSTGDGGASAHDSFRLMRCQIKTSFGGDNQLTSGEMNQSSSTTLVLRAKITAMNRAKIDEL